MNFPLDSKIFTSLFELFLTLTVTLLCNSLFRSAIKIPKHLDTRRGRTYVAVMRNIISAVLFSIAIYISFVILNINLVALLASAGIIGIALGIGARPFIEDIIAGFFLITQATVSIGDYVNVGSDIEGVIEDIKFRTITLRGTNGALQIVSNGQIKQVTNFSRRESVVYVDFPIKGGQDVDAIIGVLKEELQKFVTDEKNLYKVSPYSKVWGVQNIQVPNCLLIRVVIITSHTMREEVDKVYRYSIIKQFETLKIHFA